MMQEVIEDGNVRDLKDFADLAIKHLETHPQDEEVVQLADNITELARDKMAHPAKLYPLPEGYRYRFSGFWGQVIGVMREGATP